MTGDWCALRAQIDLYEVRGTAFSLYQVDKGAKYFIHLRALVGKDVRRIHGMDDHIGAEFEQQRPAVAGLAAVEWQIVEAGPLGDSAQCAGVPDRKVMIKIGHE